MEIIFWYGTKSLGLAQYVNLFLVWHKKFKPAQNTLRPVEGRDISRYKQGKSEAALQLSKITSFIHNYLW